MKNKNTAGIVFSVLSAILFGLTPLLAKIIYSYGFTAIMLAFSRFVLGSVFLFMIIRVQNKYKIILPKKQIGLIFVISFFYALMIILMYSAYRYIDSGLTTTLHFTYPIFVIFLSAVILRRRLNRKHILCTVIAVAGIVFLNNGTASVNYFGMTLAVLSGLSYAAYIVLTERFNLNTVPVLVLSFWISVFSSFFVAVVLLFTGVEQPVHFSPVGIIFLVLIALTTNVFAIVLFQKGLNLCGGVKASLLSTFEPLTSVMVGLTFFGESLTVYVVIGIVLILASTVILVLKSPKRKK